MNHAPHRSTGRFMVLASAEPGSRWTAQYEGMDRNVLECGDCVSHDLFNVAMSLEELEPDEAGDLPLHLFRRLQRECGDRYEIVLIDAHPEGDWEFLGFDVGERSEGSWSAIANSDDWLPKDDQRRWRSKQNEHGLFSDEPTAALFLSTYLAGDDPDLVEAEHELYDLIPVYRLRPSTDPDASDERGTS